MDEIATASGVTIAQVALNWIINFKGRYRRCHSGCHEVQQAVENAGAMNFRLSDDEMSRLDNLSRNL